LSSFTVGRTLSPFAEEIVMTLLLVGIPVDVILLTQVFAPLLPDATSVRHY
jgi:hypothetical protein